MSFGHLALRGVLLVVLLAFLGPLAYRAGWHESAGRKGDTRFYRAAAARYWAGENLYYQDGFMNPEGWRPTTAYTYLPPWALVSSWTLLFPYRAVRVLWLALMVLCAWALWRTTAALLRELEPDPGAEDLLLASYARATDVLGLSAAALLVGRFVINDLAHGQVNLLLAWLVALSLLACLRGREGWAALALAAALLIKPTVWWLVLWFALAGRWRLVALTLAGGGLGLTLVGLRYGWSGHVALLSDWLDLMHGFARDSSWEPGNASLVSLVTRSAGAGGVPSEEAMWDGRLAGLAAGLLGLGLIRWRIAGAIPAARAAASSGIDSLSPAWRRALASGAIAVLPLASLASPVTWKAHLCLLFLPAALWLRTVARRGRGWVGWLGFFGVLLLAVLPSRGLLGLGELEAAGSLVLATGLVGWGACAALPGRPQERRSSWSWATWLRRLPRLPQTSAWPELRPARRWVTIVVGLAWLLHGALLLWGTVDVPFADEWELLSPLSPPLDAPLSWELLFAVHNEHLIVPVRLSYWGLVQFGLWTAQAAILVNYLAFGLVLLVQGWLLRGWGLPPAARALALLAQLTPLAWEHHSSGFQLALSACLLGWLAALALSLSGPGARAPGPGRHFVAGSLAGLGALSFAAGVPLGLAWLTWLATEAWRRRRSGGAVLSAALPLALALAIFASQYESPPHHAPPVAPWTSEFMWAFSNVLGLGLGFRSQSHFFGLLGLLLLGAPLPSLLCSADSRQRALGWTSLALLGTLAAIALGRAGMDVRILKSSRYAPLAVLIVPLGLAGWWGWLQAEGESWRRRLWVVRGRGRQPVLHSLRQRLAPAALALIGAVTLLGYADELDLRRYRRAWDSRRVGLAKVEQALRSDRIPVACFELYPPAPLGGRLREARRLQLSFTRLERD